MHSKTFAYPKSSFFFPAQKFKMTSINDLFVFSNKMNKVKPQINGIRLRF